MGETETVGRLARIRKAVVSGTGAAAGALVAALVAVDAWTVETVSAAIGAAVACGVATGWATWRVPNAGAEPALPDLSADELLALAERAARRDSDL